MEDEGKDYKNEEMLSECERDVFNAEMSDGKLGPPVAGESDLETEEFMKRP